MRDGQKEGSKPMSWREAARRALVPRNFSVGTQLQVKAGRPQLPRVQTACCPAEGTGEGADVSPDSLPQGCISLEAGTPLPMGRAAPRLLVRAGSRHPGRSVLLWLPHGMGPQPGPENLPSAPRPCRFPDSLLHAEAESCMLTPCPPPSQRLSGQRHPG